MVRSKSLEVFLPCFVGIRNKRFGFDNEKWLQMREGKGKVIKLKGEWKLILWESFKKKGRRGKRKDIRDITFIVFDSLYLRAISA